jgi:DeoR family transcriptional regulator, fructose operon transcriptional repressor
MKAIIVSASRVIAAPGGSEPGRTFHAYVGPSYLVQTLVTGITAPAEDVAVLEGAGTVVETS